MRLLPAGDYTAGMELWESARAAARQPARLLTDLPRLTAESRRLGVLIPETAYIVVENAAQEATLKQKEKLSLGANRALSFDEHPVVKAPAPPLVWLLPVAMALILLRPRTLNGKC